MNARWLNFAVVVILLCISLSLPTASAEDVKKALYLNKEGEKLLEAGSFDQALAVFRNMLGECGSHEFCSGVAQFYLGRTYLEMGRYDTAIQHLDEAERVFERLNKANESAMVVASRGKAMAGLGDYSKALELFRRSHEVFTRLKNHKELATLLTSMAVVHAYLCNYSNALECLDQAEQLLSSSTDPVVLAALNNNRALVQFKQQRYDAALQYYHEALKHYRASGNVKGMAVVANNLGQVRESKSEYGEALKHYAESLRLAREIHDPWTQALALNNIGCVELKRGNYRASQDAFEDAYRIRTELHSTHFSAETLNNLGLLWMAYADYPKALGCFEEAMTTCEAVGALSGRAWALHNLAYVLKDQGKFKESLAASQETIAIARKIGDRRMEATAVLRLGNLYEYQGWFDRAVENYRTAAEIQRQITDWNFMSNTLSHLADVLARTGEAEKAEKQYGEALTLKQKIGAKDGDLICRMALLHIEKRRYGGDRTPGAGIQSHDLEKALQQIRLAEQSVKPDQSLDLMLLTYVKGKYFLETDPQESLRQFKQLKTLADRSGIRKFGFLASTGLGLAQEATGDVAAAERSYREAVEYAEKIRITLDPHSRLAFLDGEEILGLKHVAAYEGLARVLLKKGESDASFQWADYTKARAFSESLSMRWEPAGSTIPPDVLARDAHLNERLAAVMRGLEKARREGVGNAVEALSKEVEELSAELSRHIETLRRNHPLFAATKYPEPEALSHSAARNDEWILEYDVTDTGLLAYLMHGKKLVKALFRPVPRGEIDWLVRKFRSPMEIVPGVDDPAEKLYSFDFVSGGKLSEILLNGLLEHLPKGVPVAVIPDDSLGILPFEMLPLNNFGTIVERSGIPCTSGVEFLGDRNPISYYQSVAAISLMRTLKGGRKSEDRLFVMADPVFQHHDARAEPVATIKMAKADQEFSGALMSSVVRTTGVAASLERLPLTGALAEGLSHLYEGRSDVRTGLAASKQRLLRDMAPLLEGYSKVVFATHGFFSREIPGFREPVLVLTLVPAGTDGFLRMSEVMGLKLNSEVVALTACQTGLGRQISGEGTMGMGRAFQFAGSDSVLMSLWSVSEAASVKLIQSFFQHIKAGKSRRDALKLARDQIRREGFDHPFFWAAFILVGEVE